ncbi:type II toxin-antitoxin system ParD family antitoxin [Phormidesmis sp. 146-12]
MQISLTPELTAIIERQLASGAYGSPNEVVAAALLQFDELIDPALEAQVDEENDRRWQKFQKTGHAVSHQNVREWAYSLSTDNPLSCPQ